MELITSLRQSTYGVARSYGSYEAQGPHKVHPAKLLKGYRELSPSLCPAPQRGKEADSGLPSCSLIGRPLLWVETISKGDKIQPFISTI